MSSNDFKGASRGIVDINTTAGVIDAWLKTQQSPLITKSHMMNLNNVLLDFSKTTGTLFDDSTMNRFADLSKNMASVAAFNFPTQHLEGIQKMVAQASGLDSVAKQFSDNQAAISKMLATSFTMPKMVGFDDQFQKSIAAMTSSLVATIDTSRLQDILATASTFRDELADEVDLDELNEDFFDSHPDLAESIEESPALLTLSTMERRLIVLYVRFVVVMTVTCFILNITEQFPEIDRLWTGLGLSGGWGAGKTAADLTRKALDKLPQEESE
ncbi:UNVERIFIED_ORG: hypothetical protein ABID57_003089 [Arthrobacter sp. UYEF1]